MKFEIASSNGAAVSDHELSEFLKLVYVDEGYTTDTLAQSLFKPSLVKARGTMFIARSSIDLSLSGMVIFVPSNSKYAVIAKDNECEMHLLGVKAKFRALGLGRRLVITILEHAKKQNCSKMILWTQENMISAQRLYETCGFNRSVKMTRNGINFIVYEKVFT